MSMVYTFKNEDMLNIILQMLIESFAFQQTVLDVLLDKIASDENEANEILNNINEVSRQKKEEILQMLYAAFGSTPTV